MLTPEIISKLFAGLIVILGVILAIIVCGIFSDHIAPNCPPLMKLVDKITGTKGWDFEDE